MMQGLMLYAYFKLSKSISEYSQSTILEDAIFKEVKIIEYVVDYYKFDNELIN